MGIAVRRGETDLFEERGRTEGVAHRDKKTKIEKVFYRGESIVLFRCHINLDINFPLLTNDPPLSYNLSNSYGVARIFVGEPFFVPFFGTVTSIRAKKRGIDKSFYVYTSELFDDDGIKHERVHCFMISAEGFSVI